jgi:hypothetical protein
MEAENLMTPEQMESSDLLPFCRGFRRLVTLGEELVRRPELGPFVPFVSAVTIRILHPVSREDMAHLRAIEENRFAVSAIWPKAGHERTDIFAMESSLLFEGDAHATADYLVQLVAGIEIEAPEADTEGNITGTI